MSTSTTRECSECGASIESTDDLVMYDRATESEWKQLTGECIAGTFDGKSLSVRSAAMLSVREFRESYHNGVVLDPPDGESEAASDDDGLGFRVSRVRAAGGVVRATVGEQKTVVFATEAGIHAYAAPRHEFESIDAGVVVDGTTWDLDTGAAADGRRLDRLPSRRLYAFAWIDDHGPDAFHRPDSFD